MASGKRRPTDFGGPYVTALMTVICPVVVYALCVLCNQDKCVTGNASDVLAALGNFPTYMRESMQIHGFWSFEAFLIYCGWFLFQLLLERVVPGEMVEGVPLVGSKGGEKLKYKINGHRCFWVTAVLFFIVCNFVYPVHHLVIKLYVPLMVSSFVVSVGLSIAVHILSFRRENPPLLSPRMEHDANNIFSDFWLGREFNPRIGSFDLKFFIELRPGIFGWFVLNSSFVLAEWESQGTVSAPMVVVFVAQGIYIWDSIFHESFVLTTMDIATEALGYQLIFGGLTWVPFTYGIQFRYLLGRTFQHSLFFIILVALLNGIGYAIFRLSNGEKNNFKLYPPAASRVKQHPEKYIVAESGKVLLTTGWWGRLRHPNYLGDLLMGFSWCVACGFQSMLPYFYIVYFLILLVHRALRDDEACRAKYKNAWEEYRRRVPYIIFPYIF